MSGLKAIGIFLLLSVFANAQKLNGPVVKYSFNQGNAKDEVGDCNAKAYNLELSEDRFGNKNSAYFFPGNKDSYLNLGTSSILKPKNGSISLWVKIDQAVYRGEGVHCNPILYARSHAEDDFNEGYSIEYQFYIRKLHCNISSSEANQITVYPASTTYFRQWYHLVMTYDDKFLSYYVNGALEGRTVKNFESQFLKDDSVLVGLQYGPKNKRYFQGTIDDIAIYDRALTPTEVEALYNEPNPNRIAVFFTWVFYGFLGVIFILIIVWITKWRIRKALTIEKEKNELRNNWYEQENKVLNAQMDPHFIFNSLNTIQQFIIINDNEKAQLYLTKFSRLLRMILENNVKDKVNLREEIEIITQYLQIESLRFNNVFKYEISIDGSINTEEINIPRFLIQPFVENAIWHGLLPKEGEKHLMIFFEHVDTKTLLCIIEDNGVGRKEKPESNGKNKSLAINFIQQRLQLMTKIYKVDCNLTIIDKLDDKGKSSGTKIMVTLPILKN